jgi:hypothetical protein
MVGANRPGAAVIVELGERPWRLVPSEVLDHETVAAALAAAPLGSGATTT